MKKIQIFIALLCTATIALAQDGNAGINEATTQVKSYFSTGTNLMYAIGAIVGLVGAIKVYKKWNYKPERAIDKMAIVGIEEPGAKDKLMKSLEKGNRHQVEAIRDGKTVKLFIEANPTEHRVNLTNYKGEAQQLEHYKKPELKADTKETQQQAQTETVKKKQSKGAKMKV